MCVCCVCCREDGRADGRSGAALKTKNPHVNVGNDGYLGRKEKMMRPYVRPPFPERSGSSPRILQFLFKVFLERSVHDLVPNGFADLLQVVFE